MLGLCSSVSVSFESSGNILQKLSVKHYGSFDLGNALGILGQSWGESQVLKTRARISGFSQGLDFLRSVDWLGNSGVRLAAVGVAVITDNSSM